jgi:hypothetical protein
MLRKVLIIIGLLLAVVLAIAVYVVTNIDMVVKSRIERTASRIAQVPVTVGSVDISLARGTATLTDLVVANPPGFSDGPAMRFDEISATVQITSGTITKISAISPFIRVEGPAGRTNIDVIRGNASPPGSGGAGGGGGSQNGTAATGESSGSTGADGQDTDRAETDDGTSRVYSIELVEIEQASAEVALDNMDAPVELTLERLVLRDLNGTRSQITRQILEQLTEKIMTSVRKRLTEVAGEALRSELELRARDLEEKARAKLRELLN